MENSKNLKIGIGMQFRSSKSGVYHLATKFWNLVTICDEFDRPYRRANIPRIIWNDGHREWSRWYWFKDYEHIGKGRYINFKG